MSDELKTHVVSKVFDNLKKVTPALATLAIVCGLIIFLPIDILGKMRLNNIPDNVLMWISLVFLGSVALIIIIIVTNLLSIPVSRYKNKKLLKSLKNKLLKLNPKQKTIIIELLRAPNKGLRLDYCDGDVRYLEEYIFIRRTTTSTLTDLSGEIIFTYIPQPWLMDLYNQEPELFK